MSVSKTPEIASVEKPKMVVLDRRSILDTTDLKREYVDVPEWGGTVIIRALTGSERDAYEAEIVGSDGGTSRKFNLANIRARLVARTVIDESGKRLFLDADIPVLGGKSAAVLDRLFTVAQRLSGLSQADVKELADQMGKDQNDDSGSD